MTITTTTQIAGPVNNVFQQVLLRNAKPVCAHFLLSEEGSGSVGPHDGTLTVKWRRIENLTPTTTALTALTGAESYPFRAGTTPSVTDVTATVLKYGQVISLNEEVDLTNYDGQTAKLIEVLGISAGRSVNRLQRNVLEDNVTLIYASGASADGDVTDPISLNLIREGQSVLEVNSALKDRPMTTGDSAHATTPIGMAFAGICHIHVKEDIRDIPGFTPVEKYAGQTQLYTNEFGMVGDVRWVSSEESSIDTNSGGIPGQTVRSTNNQNADLYTSIILGKGAHGSVGLGVEHTKEVYLAGDPIPAIMMISKPRGSAGAMDPLEELSTLSWKAWHAGTMLNATFARGLRTGARKLL